MTWSQGNDVIAEAAQRFAERHGTRVEVEQISGQSSEYLQAITTRLVSDTTPDLYWNSSTTGLALATPGRAEPLDAYFARDKVSWADMVPMAQPSVQYLGDGVTWAFPIATWTTNLWYDKAHFRQSGVPEPTDGWTMERDLFEAARKLTRPTGDPATEVWGTTAPTASHLIMQYVFAFGGQVLSNDLKSVALNSPASQRGLQWNFELADKHNVAPRPSQAVNIVRRQVAMVIDGPHLLKSLRDTWEPQDIGLALVPAGPAARVSYGDTRNMSMMAGSKAKDVAWKFLLSFISPELQHLMGELQVWTPVLKASKLPGFQFGPKGPPANVGDMIRQLEYARIWPRPAEPELRNLLQTEYTNAMNGQISLQAALANVKTQGDIMLRDWWAARK
ncbi:MAG TPA: extracellular solute-binding protein [Chloroflexota bacterium]|nr:extracellular solute-binding protein [Chloroflexota bacterium]